jgi:hypothetical protein
MVTMILVFSYTSGYLYNKKENVGLIDVGTCYCGID